MRATEKVNRFLLLQFGDFNPRTGKQNTKHILFSMTFPARPRPFHNSGQGGFILIQNFFDEIVNENEINLQYLQIIRSKADTSQIQANYNIEP